MVPHMSPYSESLLVHFRRSEALKGESVNFASFDLSPRQSYDLELLLNRAFYPLQGYMNRADYESVLQGMRLTDGTLWPLPVCLDVNEALARSLEPGQPLALRDAEGFMLAVLHVEDVWRADKAAEAKAVYGTDNGTEHPGVHALLHETGDYYVGGKLEGLHLPHYYDFSELRLTPSETHRHFAQHGWRRVIGFQTREHLHCAHKAMIQRAAREAGASIFLQPAVGRPRPGDLDHFTQIRCYQEFVKHFPRNMIQLGLTVFGERLSGPRDALLQAIMHKNYGCTHTIVPDDLGDPLAGQEALYYPRGAGQRLLAQHQDELGIRMVPMTRMVYVEDMAQYVPEDEVQDGMQVKEISSAELQRRLQADLEIPEWFSFPGVVGELRRCYPPGTSRGSPSFARGFPARASPPWPRSCTSSSWKCATGRLRCWTATSCAKICPASCLFPASTAN